MEAHAFAPLDALIVDMRGRVGGYGNVPDKMIELLDGKPYTGRVEFLTRARPRFTPRAAANPGFRGRSALLIDNNTRSAAEIMAFGYKRGGFGTLFGTPDCGSGVFWCPVRDAGRSPAVRCGFRPQV